MARAVMSLQSLCLGMEGLSFAELKALRTTPFKVLIRLFSTTYMNSR